MKRIILLKNQNTKIKIRQEYIEVYTPQNSFVVAKKFIKAFYINKLAKISITVAIELAQIAPLYFIDQNGYIKAQLIEPQNETL